MSGKIFLFAFVANSLHELISIYIMNYKPNPYDRLTAFIIFVYLGSKLFEIDSKELPNS